jgi:hypothetical protein
MVLQKQSLAQAQIDGDFSLNEKKEYILTHMQAEDIKNGYWGDLQLGCSQLFGQDDWCGGGQTYDKLKEVPNVMKFVSSNKQHPSINDTVKFLSSDENDNLWFSLNEHGHISATDYFPNAKIITFENSTRMVKHRCSFIGIPTRGWESSIEDREPDFTWNTNWFFDETKTINGIKELYRLFNLDGWARSEEFIKKYYQLWQAKNKL